jgi:hypothetical protein
MAWWGRAYLASGSLVLPRQFFDEARGKLARIGRGHNSLAIGGIRGGTIATSPSAT